MKHIHFTLLCLCSFYTPMSQAYEVGDTITGSVWVIDGDSIRLTHKNHTKSEVRIFGINAPEAQTQAGKDAKYFLIRTVKTTNRKATCTIIDIDHYKRYVSQCSLSLNGEDIDIGEYMLKHKHARYMDKYMHLPSVPTHVQQIYQRYR